MSQPAVGSEFIPGCRQLLVSFGGMTHPTKGDPPFEFSRLGNSLGISCLRIRDPYQLWYLNGLPGIGVDVPAVETYLRQEIHRSQAEVVVGVGSSMGGFAALLFGARLGFHNVLAFAPKTIVYPVRRLAIGDYWFSRAQLKLLRIWRKARRYWDLQPRLSMASPQTRFHIYYEVKPYFDRLHARHLAGFPAVELHPTEHRRHGFVRDLARQGELISILQTAIEHPPLDERVDN